MEERGTRCKGKYFLRKLLSVNDGYYTFEANNLCWLKVFLETWKGKNL